MPFQLPPRLSSVLASVLAAGLTLTAASCSHLTPLGPDPAATLPQPHHLRSPFVLQAVGTQDPAPVGAGGCAAGYVWLPGGGSPGTCYRTTGTSVMITSAAVSPVSPFQPPPPPGQQAVPVQYVFWITVPAADAPALTAVTTAVTGPQPPPTQGPPAAGAATSALFISVAGHTWALVGFGTQFAGRELEVALPSKNQALQLQRILTASG